MNTGTVLESLLTLGILGFVFIVVNAVFLGILYFTRRKMDAVAKWSYVMGTVRTSTTEYRSSGDDGGANYPVVHYSYQVGGKPYEGYRIAPGGEVGGIGAAKRSPQGIPWARMYRCFTTHRIHPKPIWRRKPTARSSCGSF
jgi:hypothetical protein